MFRRKKAAEAAGPDLEGLAKFILEDDRGPPLRFVGRTAELKEIEALADQNVREGGEGLTHVITAAPGAGKTSLLRELQARWKKSGQARGVLLRADAFFDPAEVIREMLRGAGEAKAAERFGAVETEIETQHAEVGVSAVVEAKAGGASERSTQRTVRPSTFREAFEQMADRKTPVVLLVDEAQLWGSDREIDGRPISRLLVEAHLNQQKLPLLIVAAGLGDAREVLARRGASKLKSGFRVLKGLDEHGGPPAQQREAAEAFFERFRIAGSARRRAEWADALIAGTDGWPRHLTNALRGAAEALIAGGGDLAAADLEDARGRAAAHRAEYYDRQLEPFRGMPELLAEVAACLPAKPPGSPEEAGTSRHALDLAVERAYAGTPRLARSMPESEAFTMLLHKGLIQDFGQDRHACPIPSFRTYVEEFCAKKGFPVAPSGEAGEAARGMQPGA